MMLIFVMLAYVSGVASTASRNIPHRPDIVKLPPMTWIYVRTRQEASSFRIIDCFSGIPL
jgi:hypothetical protein